MSEASSVFVSIVVPVYNERDMVNAFLAKLTPVLAQLPVGHEIVFVDDGSTDGTFDCLGRQRDGNAAIAILELSRNFGKEAALVAGLQAAKGSAAIVMDVDLQDPPQLIIDMIAKWLDGADVVIAVRDDRSTDRPSRRIGARLFYWLFDLLGDTKLPRGSGDFRLMDRRVITAFLQLGERARFNKGLFAWLGFRQEFVHHDRPSAGRVGSRWRPLSLVRYALDGLVSFSTIPIRIWSTVGGLISVAALIYGTVLLARTLIFGIDTPGYASIMVAMLFLGGVNLFTLGLLGEYIGRVFTEAKQRPLFIVRNRLEATPGRGVASTGAAKRARRKPPLIDAAKN